MRLCFSLVRAACAAFVLSLTGACEDSPFDPSTTGSNEGDRCDPHARGVCGSRLDCYVPPNCSFAVCCPPQDPSNPVCYCAGNTGDDASEDGATGAGTDANQTTFAASIDARAQD